MAMFASLSFAQYNDCDTAIVDNAHLFTSDAVKTAVQTLADAGADVRVRTFPSAYGFQNLDDLEKEMEHQCKSWTGPNGKIKNNLFAIMNVDSPSAHKIGIYSGAMWKKSLNAQWTLVENHMKPGLRDKKFDDAFVLGITEATRVIQSIITNAVPTSAATPPTAPAPQAKYADPQVPVYVDPTPQTPPTDPTSLWIFVGVLGAVGMFIIAIFAVRALQREKRANLEQERGEHEEVSAAKQRAEIAQQSAASLIVEVNGEMDFFQTSCQDAERVARVKLLLASASESFGRLEKIGAANGDDSYTASQYLAIATPYENIVDKLQRAKEMMTNDPLDQEPAHTERAPEPEPVVRHRSASAADADTVPIPGRQRPRQHHVTPPEEPAPTVHQGLYHRDNSVFVDNSTTIFAPSFGQEQYTRPPERPREEYVAPVSTPAPAREREPESEPETESVSSGVSQDYSSSTPEPEVAATPEPETPESSGVSQNY